ncbi:MAG TPA: ScaI family restriction endonuclease [Terracidiphilus sp.]|jgi:hypothetical protein|nr:ScaI family restriction endonuclease [Terracidiphilus sp.]
MADSPYMGIPEEKWTEITKKLIAEHPLKTDEIRDVVLQAWNDIFDSKLGPKGFKIGTHIFPKPQIMGFFLHELIPLEFAARYPKLWRGEESSSDKDMVYVPNDKFSIEIKTSSHQTSIFGNRSYAQETDSIGKKSKSGYYLTANFQKVTSAQIRPNIVRIRFGWLDHSDWIGQVAESGQQAHLTPSADKYKLVTLLK